MEAPSTPFGMTREERTEDFFVVLCTLIVGALLFAFFDGDTVDLHSWGIDVAGVPRRNGHEHIQAFNDLTKDAVLIVQVRRGDVCDKKL